MIRDDRELFIKGRRAENQGLGVVRLCILQAGCRKPERRLISQIAEVARRLGSPQFILDTLNKASKEIQFSKAVNDIKDVIPQALLIDSHNPMLLLHDSLSRGIHAGTDEECLETAACIRLVLTEFSERISMVLKDQAELKQAISKLMNPKK